jgi:hypothetical protein
MTTIGYGEYAILTNRGRGIAILGAISGIFFA